MRLSAVFFPSKSLEHIFGVGHQSQIINFGGKFTFSAKETEKGIVFSLDNKKKIIDDFWGKNLTMVSVIVGANGVGKTSILRSISESIDKSHKKTIKIFESVNLESQKNIFYIENETSVKISFPNTENYEFQKLEKNNNLVQKLYFSPILDYDLVDSRSPIALANTYTKYLSDYYLDSISRNVSFLKDSIVDELINVYKDFPNYNRLDIRVHAARKDDITNVYAQANFATPHTGEVLIHEIDRDLRQLERKESQTISLSTFQEYLRRYKNILRKESFIEQFNKLWNLKEYQTNNDQNLIHEGNNFLKNLEVSLLSYLLLGAVFPQTGLGAGFSFEEILKKDSFEKKLDLFLHFYLVSQLQELTSDIVKQFNGIRISDSQKIIDYINSYGARKLNGIDVGKIKSSMIKDVQGFRDINDFHHWLDNHVGSGILKVENGNITFEFKSLNQNLFDEFLIFYNRMSKYFLTLPIEFKLFDITPDKKLSSGEKSLLDFYSSLFSYMQKNIDRKDFQFENYIFLLDEPELGFHPLWKKKFVLALTRTLPILFNKLNLKKDPPNLQVIFTTHDPLTLSDLPNQNIVYLSKDISNNTKISLAKGFKSFGANISDLLADSFFIDDGLMGDFAKYKIDETIDWLNAENKDGSEIHYKVIQTIDEPLIQKKLLEMFDHKMQTENLKMLEQEEIEKMIRNYESKHGKLDL